MPIRSIDRPFTNQFLICKLGEDPAPLQQLDKDILELNRLIERYTSLTTEEDALKKKLLFDIYNGRQRLISIYAITSSQNITLGRFIDQFLRYQLFSDLCNEFKNLGQDSMFEDDLKKFAQNIHLESKADEPDAQTKLSAIIANLTPEEATKFAKQLKDGSIRSENSAIPFLKSCKITLLQNKNSPTYHIQTDNPPEPPQVFILKLEPHWNSPEYFTDIDQLDATILMPIRLKRSVAILNNNRFESYNFIVTDYCSDGNLKGYGLRQYSDKEKHATAIPLFRKIVEQLLCLAKANIVGTDFKDKNWGIHFKHPRILDNKSLLHSPDGRIDLSKDVVFTPSMPPPEAMAPQKARKTPLTADRFHAYTLGLNIYSYLTEREPLDNVTPMTLSFDQTIFQSNFGKVLKDLILRLTHKDPRQAASVEAALKTLQELERSLIKEECDFLLRNVNLSGSLAQKLPEFTTQMANIVSDLKPELGAYNQQTDLETLYQFKTTLSERITQTMTDKLDSNIKGKILVSECNQLLSKIWLLRFGNADQPLKELITDSRDQIADAHAKLKGEDLQVKLEGFKEKLQVKLTALQSSATVKVLKTRISKLREFTNVNFSLDEMFNFRKANLLEETAASIAIDDRTKKFNELSQELHLAIDARGFWSDEQTKCYAPKEPTLNSKYIKNPCTFFQEVEEDILRLEDSQGFVP